MHLLPTSNLFLLIFYLSSIYTMKAQNAFSVAGTSALLLAAASVSAEASFQVSWELCLGDFFRLPRSAAARVGSACRSLSRLESVGMAVQGQILVA